MTNISRFFRGMTLRMQITENHLAFHLFCLIFGFFLGNLFGSFLEALRSFIPSDIAIIAMLCLLFEVISAYAYKLPQSQQGPLLRRGPGKWRSLAGRSLNLIKIGLLLGFFVDAYKVGS